MNEPAASLSGSVSSGGAGASGKRRAASAVLLSLGGLLGVTVPFLPWTRGLAPSTGEPFASDAFELAREGVDLRILAYVIMGVGILGVVAGLSILMGASRLGVPGAVTASIAGVMLTMAVVAGMAFAQMLGLPLVLSGGADYSYSFFPALAALAAATVLMVGGAILSVSHRRDPRRW